MFLINESHRRASDRGRRSHNSGSDTGSEYVFGCHCQVEAGEADADSHEYHSAEHHRYAFLRDHQKQHRPDDRSHYTSDDGPMQAFDAYSVAFPEKNEDVQEKSRQKHWPRYINRIYEHKKRDTEKAQSESHGSLKKSA